MGITLSMSRLGRCRRQVASQILKIPPSDPTPPEALRRMEGGNKGEITVVEAMRAQGYTLVETGKDQRRVEITSPGGIIMRGRPDGIIKDGSWKILEVKKVNNRIWKQWGHSGVASVRPSYLASTHGYMASTGLWTTRFEVANEKDERLNESIDFNLAYWNTVVKRWEEVWPVIQSGELPKPDYDGSDWNCSPEHCQWSSLCPSGLAYQRGSEVQVLQRKK